MSEQLPRNWGIKKFEDVLNYIQPTKYIVESTDYSDEYKIPVLTAGKSFILGYTNEPTGIFDKLPVIIFDDFTTANKLVNFRFKVKSSAMKILKPKDESIDLKFVFYYMQTVRITFDTHKRYWISVFSKLPIPLPPKPTQLAIVSKIEELFSELDKGIEQLKTVQQQLKTYRQSVLKWAFEGKLTNGLNLDLHDLSDEHDLSIAAEPETEYKVEGNHGNQANQKNHGSDKGELPQGWKWVKLNEIGTWKGGGTPSKSNKAFWENGNIFWVSPKDMKSKTIQDTIDKITPEAIKYSSTKLIDKGSILFVVRSGILRRTLPVAITNCEVTVNQDLQAFTPRNVLPDFVYWYVQSKNEEIRKDCSKDGTTVESIESALLKNYLIPICSTEEQNMIVQKIESRLSVADKMEESITESLQQAEALKQSILKKAFEGKLVN